MTSLFDHLFDTGDIATRSDHQLKMIFVVVIFDDINRQLIKSAHDLIFYVAQVTRNLHQHQFAFVLNNLNAIFTKMQRTKIKSRWCFRQWSHDSISRTQFFISMHVKQSFFFHTDLHINMIAFALKELLTIRWSCHNTMIQLSFVSTFHRRNFFSHFSDDLQIIWSLNMNFKKIYEKWRYRMSVFVVMTLTIIIYCCLIKI